MSLDPFLNPRCASDMLDLFVVRRSILQALRTELENVYGTVLDVGCGQTPYKSLLLAPPSRATRYIGLDLKESPWSKHADLLWDGCRIPLDTSNVDCAIATEVFEHCSDPERVMRETLRVMKPGGLLFFTVPFLWPLHDVPHDEYRYTPFALDRHLRNAGFHNVQLKALGGWDASMAQMIGLWVRGRPMSRSKHIVLSVLAAPVMRFLLHKDMPPSCFDRYGMITGLAGTARKPLE